MMGTRFQPTRVLVTLFRCPCSSGSDEKKGHGWVNILSDMQNIHTRWCPPVISWFINHSKYRYITNKNHSYWNYKPTEPLKIPWLIDCYRAIGDYTTWFTGDYDNP